MNQLSQDHSNVSNSKGINDTCEIKDILKQIIAIIGYSDKTYVKPND